MHTAIPTPVKLIKLPIFFDDLIRVCTRIYYKIALLGLSLVHQVVDLMVDE
jgi:hypothetical protein